MKKTSLGCLKLSENDYYKCSQIPLTSCKSQCNLGCEYLSCNKNISNETTNETFFEENYGMCLPKDLQAEEYQNRCDSFSQTDYVNEIDECLNIVPRIIAETKKISIILISLGAGLLLFLFTLVFYRWRVI